MRHQPRVPVVSMDDKPLMPTTPGNARIMIRDGVAKPRRNKLGLFHVRMTIPTRTETNPMVLGVDPGSLHEGLAAASKEGVNVCGQVELPKDVHKKMETRRNLRRARRFRNCARRPKRFDNRKRNGYWIAPSQLAKVQARVKAVRELCRIYPVSLIVCEDVRHDPRLGKAAKHFSTAEIGKKATYEAFAALGSLKLAAAVDTAGLREKFGLTKIGGAKRPRAFEAQAVDAVALAMGEIGCPMGGPPFHVWMALRFARRNLHLRQFRQGGIRPRYGGTTNGGVLRKGDWVEVVTKGGTPRGWVCGLPTETTKAVGVANADGKRIGQFPPGRVKLLSRAGGFTWKERTGAASPA